LISKFETIKEEDPSPGNHQSPTMRPSALNRDLVVPELAGPEDNKNESMHFDGDDEDQMEDERPRNSI
jgi:hypothetical protein